MRHDEDIEAEVEAACYGVADRAEREMDRMEAGYEKRIEALMARADTAERQRDEALRNMAHMANGISDGSEFAHVMILRAGLSRAEEVADCAVDYVEHEAQFPNPAQRGSKLYRLAEAVHIFVEFDSRKKP